MIITVKSIIKDENENEYILDQILGSGGFGNVYKAHCVNDGKIVAIKVLQNIFDSNDAYLSFQKETNQSKLIDSENVIKYFFVHDGNQFPEYPPYIIMEYTSNGTLRDIINNQNNEQIDGDTLKSIFLQLANGMKCISEHLVHRDIKPENILNFDGVLKITDFGLSKISGDSTKTMTFKNSGTPLYIAPEAWNNDSNTIQMDIYSMGIVFYELATLSFPYEIPKVFNYQDLREMHLFGSLINPIRRNPSLSPDVVSLIIKMLEKPTQKKFSNWDEIIKVLQSDPLPKDDLSEIVNKAVSLRNERDLLWKRKQAEKEKAEKDKEEKIKFAYSQYLNCVSSPIHEFSERFNNQFLNSNKIEIKESEPHITPRFSTEIRMPSGSSINIFGEVLLAETFIIKRQTSFGYETISGLPKINNKEILLWCQLTDRNARGFNILLLKNDSSIYGDWYILENTVNAFGITNRPSPFGHPISELPKEIRFFNTTHIYDMSLSSFSKEIILNFLADRV